MPNKNLQQQAETAIRQAEKRARNFYGIDLPEAAIDFSLRGRCAGQARVNHNGETCLRINLLLLAENLDAFLNNTIQHEVAHLVVNWKTLNKRQQPRPHGPEWQAVMRQCYGLEAQRCHSYQTTPARVVPRAFLYTCNCREHRLTSIMHNRISRSYRALCRSCKSPLTFVTQQRTP